MEQHSGFSWQCVKCKRKLRKKGEEHSQCGKDSQSKCLDLKSKVEGEKAEEMYKEYCLKKLPTEVLKIKLPRPTPSNSAERKKEVQEKRKSEDVLSLHLSYSEADFFDDNKKPRFEDILTEMQSHIILDVGGNRFKVSRLTLKKTNSLLTNIEKIKPLPGSASVPIYFIDRDPKFFPIILNFIRNGEIKDAMLPDDIAMLHSLDYECEFFRLEGLRRSASDKLARLSNPCRCGNKNL